MVWKPIVATSVICLLSGCATPSTDDYDNHICSVVDAGWGWKNALQQAKAGYGVSPGLVLSVIYHESSFNAQARPDRELIWGFIPWRTRTEYGYGQIKKETWEWYKGHHPGVFQSRTSFADTVDFIGWYFQIFRGKTEQSVFGEYDIDKHFYLAYQQGLGGYSRGSYENNKWLLNKARRVAERAMKYDKELSKCLS